MPLRSAAKITDALRKRLAEKQQELDTLKAEIEAKEEEGTTDTEEETEEDNTTEESLDADEKEEDEEIGMNPPSTNLTAALKLCGLNSKQLALFLEEGYDAMTQLIWLKPEGVKNLLSSITKKNPTINFKHIQQSTLRALVLWAHDQHKMDKDLTVLKFTRDTLDEYRERDQLVEDEVDVSFDTSFEPHKWVSWRRDLMAFLWATKGSSGIPLAYVVVDKEPVTPPDPKPQHYELTC